MVFLIRILDIMWVSEGVWEFQLSAILVLFRGGFGVKVFSLRSVCGCPEGP